jgi:mono/diheme cytochrome c family protein
MRMPGMEWGAAWVLAIAGASAAQAAGDPVAGRDLAAQWCSRCHDTSPGGSFKQEPPSFAAIAVYRSPEAIRSRIVLPATHAGMPELAQILGLDADDLTAYIVSLEATASP